MAKWFYLWNWRALFVLDNAVAEFKGLKEIFCYKKCYFWSCHCALNISLTERLTPIGLSGGQVTVYLHGGSPTDM